MADTLQYVQWHLEYACPFRQGEAVRAFAAARQATSRLRAIDHCEARRDVFGDTCVTGVSYQRGQKWPSGGFRISEAVAPVGSLPAAREVCGNCPANGLGPDLMAGCCGSLPFHPSDEELETDLRAGIGTRGLQKAVAGAFPKTTPLWYGFWISSPLTRPQLEILRATLAEPGSDADRAQDVRQFRRACELAIKHGIPLHATLPPLGHTDLGFYTIFPHCPRCKMPYGERWEKEYSKKRTTCRACGHEYVPAETASCEKDSYRSEDLADQLPAEEYEALRAEWERRHQSDPPSFIEQLLSGKVNIAEELRKEAAAHRSPRKDSFRWLWPWRKK